MLLKILLVVYSCLIFACSNSGTKDQASLECESNATLSSFKTESFSIDTKSSSSQLSIFLTDKLTAENLEVLIKKHNDDSFFKSKKDKSKEKLSINTTKYTLELPDPDQKKKKGLLVFKKNNIIVHKYNLIYNSTSEDGIRIFDIKPTSRIKDDLYNNKELNSKFNSKLCITNFATKKLFLSSDTKTLTLETHTEHLVQTKDLKPKNLM